jgi:hypothetical protein
VELELVDLAGEIGACSLRGIRLDAHRFDSGLVRRSEAEPGVPPTGSLHEDAVPAVRVIEQDGVVVVFDHPLAGSEKSSSTKMLALPAELLAELPSELASELGSELPPHPEVSSATTAKAAS